MAQTYTINDVDYTFPDVDDSDWGQNVTDWAGAISSFLLQRTGGTFTLSAAVDFGTAFGLKVKELDSKTSSSTVSTDTSAFLRLAKSDYISWRNNADGANLTFQKGTDDLLEFAGVDLVNLSATQTLTNKTLTSPVISGATLTGMTAIVFEGATADDYETTLTVTDPTADRTWTIPNATDTAVGKDTTDTLTNKTLTNPKMNEDVAMTTTSTYLNRMDATSAVQAQIDAKQATINAGARLNANLVGTAGTVSNTEYDYLSTVSSNIQTQINAKQATIEASARLNANLVGTAGTVSNTEYDYLSTVSSNIQTQIDAKQATITGAATTITGADLTASKVLQSNGTGKVEASSVTTTTLGYLDASSSIQTQLNAKQATVTGAATTITGADLTASKVVQSNGTGKIEASSVTTTTLGYLDATSSIQTQIDTKAPVLNPNLTGYADFNTISAPGEPSTTGQTRLYSTDSKLYFHGKDGSATEIGAGGGGANPTSTILPLAVVAVPSGYLYCDGSAVSRTTYATLYASIGVAYGYGDNATTFNVPDFRGYFLRGQDDGSGHDTDDTGRTALNTGGNTADNIGSFQDDGTAVNNLSTGVTDPGHVHSLYQALFGGSTPTAPLAGTYQSTPGTTSSTTGISVSLSSSDNETRPKNVYVRYYIKY